MKTMLPDQPCRKDITVLIETLAANSDPKKAKASRIPVTALVVGNGRGDMRERLAKKGPEWGPSRL